MTKKWIFVTGRKKLVTVFQTISLDFNVLVNLAQSDPVLTSANKWAVHSFEPSVIITYHCEGKLQYFKFEKICRIGRLAWCSLKKFNTEVKMRFAKVATQEENRTKFHKNTKYPGSHRVSDLEEVICLWVKIQSESTDNSRLTIPKDDKNEEFFWNFFLLF